MPLMRTCVFAVVCALIACAPKPAPDNAGAAPLNDAKEPPSGDAATATPPTEFVRANLLPCPWSAETVSALVGEGVIATPAVHNAADSYTVHCSYIGSDGRILEISQTWFAPGAAAAANKVLDEQIAAQASLIDGDADRARWVAGVSPGILQLVYTRANVRSEIALRGAEDTPDLRRALLALPRLPVWH